jgi:sugar lactone lactonase YvrE
VRPSPLRKSSRPRLYVADHNNGVANLADPDAPEGEPWAMKIYAFPLGEGGLVSGPRKTLVDFGKEAGCDGMTVDERGNVYLTSRRLKRPGVMIINPDGEEVGFIPTGPENQTDPERADGFPSNVEFGVGSEATVLYVTIDLSLYRIPLSVKGHRPY